MKLIALLLLLLTFSNTEQACAAGCLRCEANNCTVPDISQNYVLSNNTAVKTSLTNCAVLNPDGTCLSCAANYFVDATLKCVAVPAASAIASCSFYSSATSCRLCAAGFYLNNNVCTAVTATIANCSAYASATTCAACANNYILSLDLTSCVSVSSVSNCSGYSYVTCGSCASGYHLNRNNYLSSNLTVETADNRTNLIDYARDVIGAQDFVGLAQCTSNTGTNCLAFAVDSNVCTSCAANYYLDTAGVCNSYPTEPIVNCAVYTNATTCYSCAAGYTLSNNACTVIASGSLITGCVTYNTRSATVECLACGPSQFVSGSTCANRVDSLNLSNCTVLTPNRDTCTTCATGFTLTADSLACAANIANCQVNAVPATKTAAIQCTTCNPTFYLVAAAANGSNSCASGSIPNCATYSNNGARCDTCVNGFILANNACTQGLTITNCSAYSSATNGVCTTCNVANSVVATLLKSCQTITTRVDNCILYSGTASAAVCQECATNYFLNNNNTCTLFTITGCIAGDNTTCTQCAVGSVLNFNGSKCIAPYSYLSAQCAENSTVDGNAYTAESVTCNICNERSFPVNFNNQYACFSTTEIANKNTGGAALSAAYISNCLKLDNTLDCVQCDPASANRYLTVVANAANTCDTSCTNGYQKYVLSGSGAEIVQYNVCVANANAITGCAVYAPNLNSNTQALACISCATGYINVNTAAKADYSNADPAATVDAGNALYTNYIPAPFARFPTVTCTAYASVTSVGGAALSPAVFSATTVSNCAYFMLTPGGAAGDYSCLKCAQGYSGTFNTNGHITGCINTTGCTTVRNYNLDPVINNLASCHTCTATNNIPVVAYVSTSATDATFTRFANYNFAVLAGNTLATGNTVGARNIECRLYSTGPTSATYTWSITANCAIAAVTINTGGDNSGTNIGHYCAACKPGFSSPAGLQKTCTQISNCRTDGNLFNACSACASGYILAHDGTNVNFTSCASVANTITSNFTNCYAATVDANNAATACAVCNPGYNLNVDYICEAIQPANCVASAFRITNTPAIATANWSLYAAGNAIGCNRCATGYIASAITTNKAVCVASSYVANTVDPLSVSAYVQHCRTYVASAAAPLKCSACQTNYVLNYNANNALNATECYLNTSLANCALATDASTCHTCAAVTFTLSAAGVCTAGSIAQCAEYNYQNDGVTSLASPLCLVCNPDYYLTNNSCALGNVRNCKAFDDDANRCATCATGYYLINNSGNTGAGGATIADICLPNPTVTNCNEFTLTNSGLTCTSCASPTTQVIADIPANTATTACLAFSPVANCATFNVGTINTADFTCATCATGFYLANNRCTTRTTINKCVTYTANADTCDACDNTSYLSADKRTCVSNPAGVYRCQTYSNATQCTACRPGFYLANNLCTAVPTAIANCSTYSAAATCSGCAAGFALTNNTCVTATAQNCVTYNSASACATCNQGFVLTTANNITSCTALTKTGCATIDANPPNNCLTCSPGYYLNSGACVATTTIVRCSVYASATTCAQCEVGYSLSVDKLTCVTNARVLAYDDGNCNNSQLVASPVCSRCSAGRYFVNGACTGTCSVTGCLACSPNANATCYICNTGYYQDSTGNCIAINTSVVPESAGIFGVLSALLVVITVMIK